MNGSERKAARAHLVRLAKRHGILIRWRSLDWREYECHPGMKVAFIGKPESLMAYLAALHELGHLICPHADLARDYGHLLMEEAAAWTWAVKHMPKALRRRLTTWHYKQMGRAWASHIQGHW